MHCRQCRRQSHPGSGLVGATQGVVEFADRDIDIDRCHAEDVGDGEGPRVPRLIGRLPVEDSQANAGGFEDNVVPHGGAMAYVRGAS